MNTDLQYYYNPVTGSIQPFLPTEEPPKGCIVRDTQEDCEQYAAEREAEKDNLNLFE